jgi:hypothetical protein
MNRVGNTLIHFGPNKDLLSAFVFCSVEFVLIGGLAVAWYCSERKADDMDLLINPTSENSARISRALQSLELQGFTDQSFTKPGLQVSLKQVHYAELLTPRREGPSYSEASEEAVDRSVFNIPVRIASPSSLIRMKQQAATSDERQREKHIADIQYLTKHAI